MATLRIDQASTFDVVIDGWGYMLAETEEPSPFQLQCQDDALEKTSIDVNLEQNKLDTLYWGVNRSWHEGQGQTRLDVPPRFQIDPSTASSPYKHLRSKGMDITTRGQLTLLHKTTRVNSNANQSPNPQKLAVTDAFIYSAGLGSAVHRWSAIDGSDATIIGDGTAGNASVLDFATDGSMVFAALGTEGISRVLAVTSVQIDSMDALTNWAGSSATLSLESANKKEGTNAIKVSVANGVTGTATRTFGSAQDYSGKDQLTFWLNPPGATSVETRFITSGGNYFTGTAFPVGAGYQQYFVPRATLASVGSPSWTNINSIAFIWTNSTGGTAVIYLDDLEALTGSGFIIWGTWDARVVGWANDQLYAAGIKTGTQWRFYKAAAGTGGAEVYVLPDGWTVSDIVSLGGLVYFSAYRGGKGVIYVYDGTNSPTIACPWDAIGNGTIPLSLTPFSGAGMLIGCRRLTTSASGGLGVLYRGFPDAAGSLRVERLAIIGADDGRDYGIRCGISYGDYAYFGWNYGDEVSGENFLVDQTKRSGLGVYWPETGGYGRSYLTPTGTAYSGIVEDCTVFKGRRIFTVGGYGVFTEQTTYEAEGGVQTSLIDINVSADKVWLAQESVYSATEAITSPVAHAYSLDGATWLNDTGGGGAGSSVRVRTSFASLGLKTPSIYARTRLTTTSGTVTPVLYTTGIGGYPATKPLPVHALMIRAYPSGERLDISRTHQRHDGWTTLSRLITLWQNQTIVDYQPPWAFSDTTPGGISYKVRVAQVQATKGWNSSGDAQGGLIACQLKVVP